jgi:adenylate cyclase class 2
MLEIEVKLRVGKIADVESRLKALGAFLETPRAFEDNLVFDFPDRRLHADGVLLRLRRGARGATLTLKQKVEEEVVGAKVRRETETRVEDFDVVGAILAGLGLEVSWRYQKYRAVYRLGGLHALVDETPIGNFLELEGPKAEIDRWAGALGFEPRDYLVDTYRELYEAWRDERSRPDGPLVFPEGPA